MWFFFTFSGGLKQIYTTLFEPWEKSSQKFLIVGVLGGGKPFSESLFHSNSAWSTFPDGEIHGVTEWSNVCTLVNRKCTSIEHPRVENQTLTGTGTLPF